LTEWLCYNYEGFGAKLEFITDKSQEGYQFCNGFGGIGGFLRYKLNMDDLMKGAYADQDDFDPDDDFI
jgi:peptide chain release factor subunit 1